MAKAKAKLTTRQRTSRKINRKRAVRKWWMIISRRVLIAACAVLAVALAAASLWFWRSGKLEMAAENVSYHLWSPTAKLGFRLEDVYLEGRKFTPMEDVNQAMGVRRGDPILAISLDDMRARLQAIPRVKYAEVARVLPNQLHVHIVEREPVAVWQDEKKLRLVDDDGIVMEYVDPAQYPSLMLVVGEDAPSHVHELLTMMALEPDLYREVSSASRVGERRWNIRFKNGVELKLPEHGEADAWRNFARMESENHLLSRAITSVDMRLPDRIFIKTVPAPEKPVKAGGGRET